MRDFPLFSTDTGVSSLLLKEVPYRKTAYIRIGDVQEGGLSAHLEECLSFCRMAGAENVYASGHGGLEKYPLHTSVVRMRMEAWVDRQKLASLFPVTEATVERWRQIYNDAMGGVDNAATQESRDEKRIIDSGGAYFVHADGDLLGIGWLEDTKLLAVASVKKGMGETVMHTLMSLIEGSPMELEVASTNTRAIRLYEKLGFLATGEISRWYTISKKMDKSFAV